MAKNKEMTMDEAQKEIKKLTLDASANKPSQEETEKAAKDFESKKIDFENRKFKVGAAKDADEIYDFMLDFLENHVFWTKNGWMGVLRMHEELTESKKTKKKNEAFSVGYQALEFMFFALSNPGGYGLASAKRVETVAEFYGNLIETTGKVLEDSRKELADIQFLGEQAAAMQQGFYIEREDGIVQPGPEGEGFEPPSIDELLRKV
jgi:hypothetical protein